MTKRRLDSDSDDDEDDYMSMAFEDAGPSEKELADQQRERANEELNPLHSVLKKSIITDDSSSKGLAIMRKMGFKVEEPSNDPIYLERKQDRGGLGYDSERKRHRMEEVDKAIEEQKKDKVDYRAQIAKTKDQERIDSSIVATQKMAIELDARAANTDVEHIYDTEVYSDLPIVYRVYVLDRQYDRLKSKLSGSDDVEARVIAKQLDDLVGVTDEATKDPFFDLDPSNRLLRLLTYLREKHFYCIWCGEEYESAEDLAEYCPGIEEKDH